jgi:hypothetical protein
LSTQAFIAASRTPSSLPSEWGFLDTVWAGAEDYRLFDSRSYRTYRKGVTPMRSVRLIVLVLLSVAAPLAWSQGGNPPASTQESGQTSGRGQTAVEQTATGSTPEKKVPSQQVQQALIALDKQWGEAGSKGDTATLNKILSDNYLGVGAKGEGLGKQEQVAATTATSVNLQNASYIVLTNTSSKCSVPMSS